MTALTLEPILCGCDRHRYSASTGKVLVTPASVLNQGHKEYQERLAVREQLNFKLNNMKYSSSFYYDVEFGETAEDWASEVFNSGKKIEVKFDRMACETGNIFIEYMSRGKPSGIATTQADYWIYKIDYTGAAIILDVVILKEKLRGYHARGMYLKNGGDNDTSKGFVIPIREIIKP